MNEDIPPAAEASSAAAPTDPENLFAVALAKNSGNDSFPVLNAFQTFLDQERERARRRVVTMAVCFTGAMIVLLLVFGILFATFFSRMMVRNDRQQDRLLDLVARGIPAAVHEAGYTTPAEDGVSRREVLELLQQMSLSRTANGGAAAQSLPAGLAPVPAAAPQAAPAPTPVIPASVVPAGSQVAAGVAVPVSPARDDLVAAPPPRTGVLSVADRQAQKAKEDAEEAARRARIAAARDAEAKAAAAAQSPTAAPVPARDDLAEGGSPAAAPMARDDLAEGAPAAPVPLVPAPPAEPVAPTGPLPFALPAGAAPTAAVAPVPLDAVALAAPAREAPATAVPAPVAEQKNAGRRAITVKPKSRMGVPEGFSTDRTEVETGSGSRIPFRLLVPVPDASR